MPQKADKTDPAPVEFECHADYNDTNSDLLLVSCDGQGFRVHSIIMKLASDVFRTMIDEGPLHDERRKEPIRVQENANILNGLLDIIYPNRLSLGTSTPSFDTFRQICLAAEKYEMSAVLNTLRIYLSSMASTKSSLVLPAFALASRFGWSEEMRSLSAATLSIDLQSIESMELLKNIPSSEVLKLMALHRKRRNLLVACLSLKAVKGYSNEPSFAAYTILWHEVKSEASGCFCVQPSFQTPLWIVLRHRISEEMERNSDGATIRQQVFWNRSEFGEIWTNTCGSCYKPKGGLIDKQMLKDAVLAVLDRLPKTI